MKKVIALFLCCALVVPFCLPATAEALSFGYSDQKTEVISKREVYSKTYLLPDGTYQYVSYAEPIHYKDSTGAYVEINNEVTDAVKRDGYKYSNTSNAWNAFFSEKLNNSNAVMLTSGGYDISFSFVGQTGTAAVTKATAISRNNSKDALATYYQNISADNRAVIYSDVIENVDIAYTVKTGALKEDIILRKKQAANTFKFRLTTNGLTLRESGDTLALFTAAGKEVFAFAPLYMEDANGKRSEKVALTYTNVKNGYELTITADAEFLNAADTVYPVVIDPSVMVTGSSDTYDTCADQQYPTSNYYLSENLWTGGALGTNAMRTYIKFDLPSGISYNQIISASIYLRKKEHQTPTVRAYILTESWSSSTLTWNAMPAYDSTVCSQVAVNSVGDWYGLNITTLLQCWLYGSYANNGVVIKEPSETSSGQKTKFYSSDAPSPNKPELVINYSVSKTLSDVPTNLASNTDHYCIPCAITNVAAYWSINGYSQFGCSTASAQETVARNVQSAMIAAGGSAGYGNNNMIQDGFNIFSHSAGGVTYGLRATNYWAKNNAFTYSDIVSEINAGRPLLLGFGNTDDSPFNGAHMTACAGYMYSDIGQFVIVSDAWRHDLQTYRFSIETYNDFISKVEIVSR